LNTWFTTNSGDNSRQRRWIIPLGIFVLALLIRIPALGKFITTDEAIWMDSSQAFAGGLLFSDYECQPMPGEEGRKFVGHGLECTYNLPHPGVTTTWGGSLGLVTYYWLAVRPTGVDLRTFLHGIAIDSFDPKLIVPARMPLVVAAALFVCLFYLLLRRLLDDRLALLATLLLALHPFHIAHSRVLHHDALTTTFMGLSLLTMLGYWLQAWKRPWLLASAALAALAFLSKPVGWLMIPYAGLLGLLSLYYRRQHGQWHGWPDVRRLIADGLLWAVTASFTCFALFPALWVIPGQVISKTFADITRSVESGHTQYFLGHVSADPGPLFYPLGWLLRASPLEVLGLLALLVAVWRSLRSRPLPSLRRHLDAHPLLVAMALFLVMLLAYETTSDKKMIRYFLPAFPVIDIFASLGLLWLTQLIARQWRGIRHLIPRLSSRWSSSSLDPGYRGLILAVLIIQASLALPHSPYYFTYFNPLFGGLRVASRLTSVGWGEGLESAADYLNQKPNADKLKVNVWFWQSFAPYFRGTTKPFFSIGRAMSMDYLVFYIHQFQLQSPGPELQSYFLGHYQPEHVVSLKGVGYDWIYAVPVERRTNWEATNVFGKLILYGYRQERASPGVFAAQLVWENKGMTAEDSLWAALQRCEIGSQPLCSQSVAWQPCTLAPGFEQDAQRVGALAESRCELDIADLGPGIYSLHIGLGPSTVGLSARSPAAPQDVTDLTAPQGELGVSVCEIGTPSIISPQEALDALASRILPPDSLPLHVAYGNSVALIGYQVTSPSPRADRTASVTLYWQALQDIPQPTNMAGEFRVRFDLVAPNDSQIPPLTDHLSGLATLGDVWQSGQVLADQHQVSVPEHLAPGNYRLAVALVRADNEELVPALDQATGQISTDRVQLEPIVLVP
jgi:hypothetical protein